MCLLQISYHQVVGFILELSDPILDIAKNTVLEISKKINSSYFEPYDDKNIPDIIEKRDDISIIRAKY